MKMEAKELMIGDWVKIESTQKPIRFDEIDFVNNANGLLNVESIPLTEDVLKANGFIVEGGVLVFFSQGVELPNDYIECCVRRDGEVRKIEMIHYDRSFKIDRSKHISVHQFQHALRLVGLTDLADKFKLK